MEELVPLLVKACQIKQFPKEKNIKKKKKKNWEGEGTEIGPKQKKRRASKKKN